MPEQRPSRPIERTEERSRTADHHQDGGDFDRTPAQPANPPPPPPMEKPAEEK